MVAFPEKARKPELLKEVVTALYLSASEYNICLKALHNDRLSANHIPSPFGAGAVIAALISWLGIPHRSYLERLIPNCSWDEQLEREMGVEPAFAETFGKIITAHSCGNGKCLTIGRLCETADTFL